MKKFFISIPKVFFAILCYLSALLLAILSGYFSIMFYAKSQSGWNMWAMGGLAGMLEFIKIMLATAYPFMKYRDSKTEKKVSFYLKICFFLSVMASLNFFMSGGSVERSPASAITKLLYDYMPILNIIPLKFSQFLTTMSLSILVEAFIVFLPILAPIMFLEKDYDRKHKRNAANTNMEKLKEIVTIIPERLIDNLHKKVVGSNENPKNDLLIESTETNIKDNKDNDIEVVEIKEKPKLKLLKSGNYENKIPLVLGNIDKEYDDHDNSLTNDEDLDFDSSYTNSEDKQKLLDMMYKYKNMNICPSVKQLMNYTGFSKNKIHIIKKSLEESGILKTEGSRTILLCDYDDALDKIWAWAQTRSLHLKCEGFIYSSSSLTKSKFLYRLLKNSSSYSRWL